MENCQFIDVLPIKHGGFSMAMLNNQMVIKPTLQKQLMANEYKSHI
jgi:hypothetical protein